LLWTGAAVGCICIASLWRLAKFNVDTRQSTGFLGLPTPANGLFWASLVLGAAGSGVAAFGPAQALQQQLTAFLAVPALVCAAALLLGILMLSELPLPSLKFKHGGWKGNQVVFLLGGIGIVLALLFGILAVPLLLVLYLLSPFW